MNKMRIAIASENYFEQTVLVGASLLEKLNTVLAFNGEPTTVIGAFDEINLLCGGEYQITAAAAVEALLMGIKIEDALKDSPTSWQKELVVN